ncbi:MAG TPA: TetR/AcrR family transcriptional regulator [Moraxellaceae bacterium]|nr:TetR/AcrR family transcriptional regulator [Moraxellaceae bacterium]
MSTSGREPADESRYHHGRLREALVTEGLRLLEESGEGAFSLRELARRLGVSANAAYRHFASKEALLEALAAEGFRRFAAGQLMAARGGDSPQAGFLAAGRAYVAFAEAHPALFRLMFGRFSADRHGDELAAAGELAYEGLRHGVAAALGRPVADPEVDVAVLRAWSLVHGLSHLVLDGQLARRLGNAAAVQACIEAVLRQALAEAPAA